MKRFAAFILAAGMLLCLGCADGNVISCPAGDGSARGNAAPTQLNKVENVKVLSFEKWSEQREAMGVDESTYGAMAAFAAKSAGSINTGVFVTRNTITIYAIMPSSFVRGSRRCMAELPGKYWPSVISFIMPGLLLKGA